MSRRPAGSRLTAREREIANLLGLGLTNKEIALRLKISQRTADAHVQNMLNKLGASNRAQIVALAPSDAASTQAVGSAEPHHEPAPLSPRGLTSARRPALLAVLVAGALVTVLILSADHRANLFTTSGGTITAGITDREITDPFSGHDVDTSIWDVDSSDRVYVSENNGHLGIYVATSAPQQFSGGLSTACSARGDFDARVSFELVTWPPQDGVWVSLIGRGIPFDSYRVSAFGSESYGAYLPPAGRIVKASGRTGSLRLSRTGSKWSGYYLIDGHWSWIASGDGPTQDVGLSVILFNGDVASFGGKEALVYFHDFQLVADKVVCS